MQGTPANVTVTATTSPIPNNQHRQAAIINRSPSADQFKLMKSSVQCPNCDRAVPESAVFCTGCDARIQDVCPNCNALSPVGSTFCQECGFHLPGVADTGPTTAQDQGLAATPAFQAACPRCRSINEPGVAFCFSCGLSLDGNQPPAVLLFPAGTPAGFWIRFGAWFIDLVVLIVAQVAVAAAWPGTSVSEHFGSEELWTAFDSVNLVVSVLYYTLGVSIWSTTIGKRLLGLYVLRPDGSKAGPGYAFARWLGYIPSTLLLLGGYLMVAFRDDKRALHDLMADTVVIRRR